MAENHKNNNPKMKKKQITLRLNMGNGTWIQGMEYLTQQEGKARPLLWCLVQHPVWNKCCLIKEQREKIDKK